MVLSLHNAKKKYQVTHDSAANFCFEVCKNNGTIHVVTPCKKGILYSSVNNDVKTAQARAVEKNICKYTAREYFGA